MFNGLDLFVRYLEEGNKSFEESIGSGICATTQNSNNFDYLCFADSDGDVINHLGKKQGNVSDLSFYGRIMGGDARVIDISFSTFNSPEPKVIIAMPLSNSGKTVGVVFGITDMAEMKLQFFRYSGEVESIIIDSDSAVVASNRDYKIGTKLEDFSPDKIIVKHKLDFNGWQLLTVMDKTAAIERYKGKK